KSYWNAKSPTTFPDGFKISNAALHGGPCTACDLLVATKYSLNVPFYGLTYSIGPANVLKMARDAGIDYIWNDDGDRVDLRKADPVKVAQKYYFDSHIGIGQY